MKRERIVRTENIDRQRIKYRVLFGFIFIMCCNGAALPSEDGKMPDWKFSFSLKRIPMIRIFDEIEQKSDFVFAWSCDIDNEIHEEISICVTEEPIQKVMEKVLKGSGLVYQRLDRQIVVYRLLGLIWNRMTDRLPEIYRFSFHSVRSDKSGMRISFR